MDGFTLVLWAVRLLFLALLYLFLARVIRVLLRDLRAAAAQEPVDRPRGVWWSSNLRVGSQHWGGRLDSTSSPRSVVM